MADEKMLGKIRALLAKAESTTPEEAEACTDKVIELMTRHAISERDLRAPEDEIGYEQMHVAGEQWQTMWTLVGQALGFVVVLDTRSSEARWFGFKSDLASALLLWTSLNVQLAEAMRVSLHARASSSERRSFVIGWSISVSQRILLRRERVGDEESTGSALALVDRDTLVQHWADENLRLPTTRPKLSPLDAEAVQTGRSSGYGADLLDTRLGQVRGELG